MGRHGAVAIALVALLLAGAIAAAAGVSDASGPPPPSCPPAGSRTIARDRVLRIYARPGTGFPQAPVVACPAGGGTGMTIVPAHRGGFGRGFGLRGVAGPFVAYVVSEFGVDSGSAELRVAEPARRLVLRSEEDAEYWTDGGLIARLRITQLRLRGDGALAWIAERSGRLAHEPTTLTLYAAAPSGRPVVLAEGPDIGPSSLSLAGAVVRWWQAGVQRSAPMP